jgi:ribonuclease HI
VKEDPTPESLPLFEEKKETFLPSEKKILQLLSETLSVTKTLKRFPSLTPKFLQEVLQRCDDRAEEDPKLPPPNFDPAESPEFCIHADGGSRGNPGESGAGAVISDSRGRTLKELKVYLGIASNNEAEYQAAILALERALELGVRRVTLFLDSELVVRQLRGEYRVREPRLKSLHQKARDTLNRFSQYSILSIPREENRRADQLANEAIEQKIKD